MKHLLIKKVGPIKYVDVELKLYNFIIGPQSSGKSTIAKIFSTCQWVEKEVATMQNERIIGTGNDFVELVESFHKMEGYFCPESEVLYETDAIIIHYHDKSLDIVIKPGYKYRREKICYIPAERNAITLPELRGLEFGNTNIRSFLFDWFNARELYNPDNKLGVLNLDIKYYYDKSLQLNKDRISHYNGISYEIPLASASSGLQSVVPLTVMLSYYTNEYFDTFQHKTSFDENDKERQIRSNLIDNLVLEPQFPGFKQEQRQNLIRKLDDLLMHHDPEQTKIFDRFRKVLQQMLVPIRTSFVIEEPEQNIYPMTQIELIDRIITLCSNKKKHSVMITTHSPVIISYVNVLLQEKVKPEDINVWSISNGALLDLKGYDESTQTYIIDGYELSAPMMTVFGLYKKGKNADKSK
jgi:ABC-type lipoprotein export system ATPase subunit